MSCLNFPVEKGGLLQSYAGLSPKQREQYLALRARGIDDETAKQLALMLADDGKRKKSETYPTGSISSAPLEDQGDGYYDRLKDAQRLVAGIDYELLLGATGVEDARARASRNMATQWNMYDHVFRYTAEIVTAEGIDIDLGSGQARRRGTLGIDLYPYDFGTAVWDVQSGLPFEDNTIRTIFISNALPQLAETPSQMMYLFSEMQRVLVYDGCILYEGMQDLGDAVDLSKFPGLVLVGHQDSSPDSDTRPGAAYKQELVRIRANVPRVFGADGEWLGSQEESSQDLHDGLRMMGQVVPANATMAQLLDPDADASMPIGPMGLGAQASAVDTATLKQIVYCVVTAPNEIDTDGEFMTADAIEEMAHNAMLSGLEIRFNHGEDAIDAHIVESWVSPVTYDTQGPFGPQVVPKGAWMVGIKVFASDIWNAVMRGDITGFSIGGIALLET